MDKKKILFLINPIAGRKNNVDYKKYIDKYINKSVFDYHTSYSRIDTYPAEELGKFEIVVAVGGDGTVNQVINSLNGNESILAIIPAGSGNGLAFSLGIPFKIRKALELINNYEDNLQQIDVISVNDKLAVNQLGIGFDAHIANLFSTTRKRGLLKYAYLSLREYFRYKNQTLSLSANGENYREHTFVTNLSNNTQFGNNAHIAPLADLQDGLIEISFLKHFPKILLPLILLRLFTKTIHKSRYYSSFKAREAIISPYRNMVMNIDGEPVVVNEELKVKILPLALQVVSSQNN